MMNAKQVRTFTELPFPSFENSCTIVDFQIDSNKEICITQALGGYEMMNVRIDNMENEQGNIDYILLENVHGTGTRPAGECVRNDVINILNQTGKVINIDFQGIGVVASSFADEFIGKMIVELGVLDFNNSIRLRNLNPTVKFIVERSVRQRLAESFGKPTLINNDNIL